jgi:hypothetical protein
MGTCWMVSSAPLLIHSHDIHVLGINHETRLSQSNVIQCWIVVEFNSTKRQRRNGQVSRRMDVTSYYPCTDPSHEPP